MRWLSFLLLTCVVAVLTASAQDRGNGSWPQWRGLAHDGSIAGESLVEEFPDGGPPVLWIRELGQGYSSFAAAGDCVYTMSQTLYEQQLICLEAATGRTRWTANVGWPYDGGGLYPGPRSTPTVYGSHVFYCTPQEWSVVCGRPMAGLCGRWISMRSTKAGARSSVIHVRHW